MRLLSSHAGTWVIDHDDARFEFDLDEHDRVTYFSMYREEGISARRLHNVVLGEFLKFIAACRRGEVHVSAE